MTKAQFYISNSPNISISPSSTSMKIRRLNSLISRLRLQRNIINSRRKRLKTRVLMARKKRTRSMDQVSKKASPEKKAVTEETITRALTERISATAVRTREAVREEEEAAIEAKVAIEAIEVVIKEMTLTMMASRWSKKSQISLREEEEVEVAREVAVAAEDGEAGATQATTDHILTRCLAEAGAISAQTMMAQFKPLPQFPSEDD